MASGTLNKQLIVKPYTISNITIGAKDVYRFNGISIPDGYMPIGSFIVMDGAETTISALSPKKRPTDGATAIIEIYNSYSSSLTVSLTLNVIFAKV